DLADTPFVSVQDLDSPDRKYAYGTWQLSPDGAVLSVQPVSLRLIPVTTPTSADIQRLLTQNLDNPYLLGEPVVFTRRKPAKP
ncbi:MAG: hypothetical protein ACHQ4G_13420, partial [Opitutales bacterium]